MKNVLIYFDRDEPADLLQFKEYEKKVSILISKATEILEKNK